MGELEQRTERGQRYLWQVARRIPVDAELQNLHPLLAHLLHGRGLSSAVAVRRFLHPEEEALADPLEMAGCPEGVERLERALETGETVAVYGDYDVDGLTAAAVLAVTLRRLGGRVETFIPHRERDGYGLSSGPLEQLKLAGASLVVTVDCGVTAHREIAAARENGLEVLVTDHHPAPAHLPDAIVLNPTRLDCRYPFKQLAGVGVAYRLAEALLKRRLGWSAAGAACAELEELVAIGTLADMVPLVGENRTIVRRGLARLTSTRRVGLRTLLYRLKRRPVDAEHLTYTVIPRLNAAGRFGQAEMALELLLTDDPERAAQIVDSLEALNEERRRRTGEAMAELRGRLSGRDPGAAIVLSGPYPLGLVGLLATRLAEEYGRPAVVLRHGDPLSVGSARSAGGLDLVEALAATGEHLERFGGHSQAAGLSVRTSELEDFERRLLEVVASSMSSAPKEPSLPIEAELRDSTAASRSLRDLLAHLAPYGTGNPNPVFLTRRLRVRDRRQAGGVTRLQLQGNAACLWVVQFGSIAAAPATGAVVDLAYRVRPARRLRAFGDEIELLDWKPATDQLPDEQNGAPSGLVGEPS